MMLGRRCTLAIACLLFALPASAQSTPVFYKALPYGSESMINPLQMLLNGAFDISVTRNRSNRLVDFRLAHGYDMLMLNLKHPVASIENEGWWPFLSHEILPLTLNWQDARYWPNYTLHVIGGGMSYRLLGEWYEREGFAHPRLWSAATLSLSAFVNEMMEAASYKGYCNDPVADLLLFDPLGFLVFNSDPVARFFGETLQMRDWSLQPVYNFERGTLRNNGQNFSIRWMPPAWERTSLFYYFGHHGEGGLSRRLPGGDAISVAAGFRAGELQEREHGVLSLSMDFSAGIFWDRQGSLLAALQFANAPENTLQMNLYPGVFRIGRFSPGLVLIWDREGNHLLAGLNLNWPRWQPLGLARGAEF